MNPLFKMRILQNLSRKLVRPSFMSCQFASQFSAQSKFQDTDQSNQTHFGFETVDENEKSEKGKKY